MNLKKTLALACILLAAIFYIKKVELPHQQEIANKGAVLTDLSIAQARSIEVIKQQPAGTPAAADQKELNFTLVNSKPHDGVVPTPVPAGGSRVDSTVETAKLWHLDGVEGGGLDPAVLTGFVNALKDLKADGPLPADQVGNDLSVFGLKDPALKINVKVDDKNSVQLSVGSENQYLSKRYLQISGDNGIYMIPSLSFTSLNKNRDDFRNKTPVSFFDADIKTVELEGEKGKVTVEQGSPGVWQVTSPVQKTGSARHISDLLFSLKGLRAAEFVDNAGGDLSAFGLDKPSLVAQLKFDDKKSTQPLTIKIGKAAKKNEGAKDSESYYFTTSTSGAVYKAVSNPLPQISKGADDLRDKEMFKLEVDAVQKISLSGSQVGSLEISRDGEKWTVNGKEGDALYVRQVLNNFSTLEASSFPSAPGQDPFKNSRLKAVLLVRKAADSKDTETKTLLIGDKFDKSDEYYARVGEAGDLFAIKGEDLKKLAPSEVALLRHESKLGDEESAGEDEEAGAPEPLPIE